jgi:hypothetical protein
MFEVVFTLDVDTVEEAYEVRDFLLEIVAEDGRYLITDVAVYDG